MKKKQYITPELEIYSYAVEEGFAISHFNPPYEEFGLDFQPNGLLLEQYQERDDAPWTGPSAWETF